MGCGPSEIAKAEPGFDYCNATFHWVDTVRLIDEQPRALSLAKKAVARGWPAGVKSVVATAGASDIELHGRPFVKGASRADLVNSKATAAYIMEYLLADGWCAIASAEVVRINAQSSVFFRHYPDRAMGDKSPARVTVVSFTGTEDLHIVKASDKEFECCKEAFEEKYPPGIKQTQAYKDGSYVLQLHDYPWTSEKRAGMEARFAFLQLIRKYESLGWYLYANANLHGTADCVCFVKHADGNGWCEPAEYAMLSLNDRDKLRLLDLPEDTHGAVKQAILSIRGKSGISAARDYHGAVEFQLRGSPWSAEAQEVVVSKQTVMKVLQALRHRGWTVALTVDMSRKLNDKAVFVLKSCAPAKADYLCVAPIEVDKLVVINAGADVVALVKETIDEHYANGLQSEEADYYGGHVFKLRGQPWYGRTGTDEVFGRHFIDHLLKRLDAVGWSVLCASDVSSRHMRTENGPDFKLDASAWFFCKV